MKIDITPAAINAFARLCHSFGRRLEFTVHGLDEEGTSSIFRKDGSYEGRDNSLSGDWTDMDPIAAVDHLLWKECEAQFEAFQRDLIASEDDELPNEFIDVWIDIAISEGHYIVNAQTGQIMREG